MLGAFTLLNASCYSELGLLSDYSRSIQVTASGFIGSPFLSAFSVFQGYI